MDGVAHANLPNDDAGVGGGVSAYSVKEYVEGRQRMGLPFPDTFELTFFVDQHLAYVNPGLSIDEAVREVLPGFPEPIQDAVKAEYVRWHTK